MIDTFAASYINAAFKRSFHSRIIEKREEARGEVEYYIKPFIEFYSGYDEMDERIRNTVNSENIGLRIWKKAIALQC